MEIPFAAIHRTSTHFHCARARPKCCVLVYGMTAPSLCAWVHWCSPGSSAPLAASGPWLSSCGHWKCAVKPRRLHDCVWGMGKKKKKKKDDGGWRCAESPAWALLGYRFSGMVDPGCAGNRWGIGSWCICCWTPYFILPHRGPLQTVNWTTSDCVLAAEGHIILPHHGPRQGPGGGESSLPFAFHPTERADNLLLTLSTMCFTIPSPKKVQPTSVHSSIWMYMALVQCSLRLNKNPSIHLDRFRIWPFGWGTGSMGAHAVQLHSSVGWSGEQDRREGRKKQICHQLFDNVYLNSANELDGEDNLKQQKYPKLLALDAGRVVPQAR